MGFNIFKDCFHKMFLLEQDNSSKNIRKSFEPANFVQFLLTKDRFIISNKENSVNPYWSIIFYFALKNKDIINKSELR